MHNQTRKFGVMYADPVTDTDLFNKTAAKYGVKFAPGASIPYPASDDPFGDTTVAQEQAPVAIAKFKSAGVTTILLLSDSAMTKGLLNQATANDYHPEWIIGSFQYNDLGFFSRQYDQDQFAHAFGISNLPPGIKEGAPTANPALDAVQWYWGEGRGTSSVLHGNLIDKFMRGITYAGPEAHAADPPAGPLRRAGVRWLRVGRHVHDSAGIRPDRRTAVRRVPPRQQGLHRRLVGSRHRGSPTDQLGLAWRPGNPVVPELSAALLRRPLADQAAEVLRQVELDLPVRDRGDATRTGAV